ncbi:MAG: hypothetical protein ACFB4J_14430 [Elainellaceae cyanobacterium]
MTPRFATADAWEQANLLMQPAFIRVVDNLRKQLERSPWQGAYRDVLVWPEGTEEAERRRVLHLQEALKAASSAEVADIQASLSQMPQPYPGYELCLTQGEQEVTVELWQLCYRICFLNYGEGAAAVVDAELIDEVGDVDWPQLDAKAKLLIEEIFAGLPQSKAEMGERGELNQLR